MTEDTDQLVAIPANLWSEIVEALKERSRHPRRSRRVDDEMTNSKSGGNLR